MINQGFNPLEEMSRKTGKTIGQLKDEMSKGAISAKMVQDAFMSATQEGGKFFGMSEAGANTIDGQLSMLEDAWGSALNEIGSWVEDFAKGALSVSTTLVDNWQKLIPIILGVAGAYGASKVAELLAVAAEEQLAAAKAKTLGVTIAATGAETAHGTALSFSTVKTLLFAKAQAALNAVLAVCPYVAVAAGIAALGYVFYSAAVEGREFEKAQGSMNQRLAEAEIQTRKDTAELQILCDAYRDADKAVKEMNDAVGKGEDGTEKIKGQTEATKELTKETQTGTDAQRQRADALRAGSVAESEAAKTTGEHTDAVSEETDTTKDNSDATETNEEKQKKLNSAKGELIALANKYKVELTEEQLKIENLASTYETLAQRIRDVNQAKAVQSIREEAQTNMSSARDNALSQVSATFSKDVITDDKNVDERVNLMNAQTKGMEALNEIFTAIASGKLSLSAEDFKGLTNDLVDQSWNSTANYEKNLGRIMAQITSAVGEEQAQKFRDMLSVVEDSSFYERNMHDFSEQIFTSMRDAAANSLNIQATDQLAKDLKDTTDDINKKEEKEVAKHNLSEITKRIKEAQDEITKLRKKMQTGDFTDEDVKKLEEWQKKEDTAKKEYKQATGKDYGAQTKDSAKKLKEAELNLEKELYNLRKQEENIYKGALQSQLSKTESLSEQKKLQDEILEIERKQAIEDLKRQEAEKLRQIKERKDLNSKDKEKLTKKTKELYEGDGESAGLIGVKEREFDAKSAQQEFDYLKKQEEQLKGLLNSYGDYYDKRKAIEEKYEKERRKMLESGVSANSSEMVNLDKAEAEEQKSLNKSYTYNEDEWEAALAVEREINKIAETAVADGTQAMMQAVAEYIYAIESQINTLDSEIEQAKRAGDATKAMELDKKRLGLQKQVNKAKEMERSYQQDIAQHNGKSQKEIEKQNKKFEKQKKVIGLVKTGFEELGDIMGEDEKKYAELVVVIADSTMSVIGSVQSYTDEVNKAMEKSADGAAESVKTVEKASVILAVIGAVIQVATKIFNMFAKGNDTSGLVSQWRDVAGIYSEMASAQADLASNARTAEQAAEATDKQTDALRRQAEAEKEAIKARAANRSKNAHSTGYRMNEQLQGGDWQSAFNAAGVSVRNWEDLMNLAPEKLREIRENNAFLWSSLDGDIRNSLESLISIDEQGKQAAEDLEDRFAGLSLDALKDSAYDVFSDMDAQSTAFTDNLKSSLRDAIIQGSIEKEYAKELDDLQKDMARMGKEGVSPEEAAEIMQRGKDLQERINASKARLAEDYAESGLFQADSKDDNTVTTGTFAEMSEATANALEGRFTAVYESNLRIESAVTANGGIIGSLAEINASIAEQIATGARMEAEAQTETQRILAESLLELRDIRANGTGILQIVRSMASDLAEVKNSTAKL